MTKTARQIDLPHLASRVFGTPLAIARGKLDAILAVIAPRLGVVAPAIEVRADQREREYAREKKAELGEIKTSPRTEDGIARIQVVGTLVHRAGGIDALSGLTTYGDIGAQLDAALGDDRVQAILIEIDSPGGEVSGMFDLAARIAAAEKPVYAVACEDAYSAAYLIASAADRIYVPGSGGLGSIGIVGLHLDQSKADAAEGRTYTYLHYGTKKVDGNHHEPLSDRARADMQADVDELGEQFVAAVARNRSLAQKAVRETQAGTFMGAKAVEAGLADQVGTLDVALGDLRALVARRRNAMKTREKLGLKPEATDQEVEAALDLVVAGNARCAAAEARVLELVGAASKAKQARAEELVDTARKEGADVGVLMPPAEREEILAMLACDDARLERAGATLLEKHKAQIAQAKKAQGGKTVPFTSEDGRGAKGNTIEDQILARNGYERDAQGVLTKKTK